MKVFEKSERESIFSFLCLFFFRFRTDFYDDCLSGSPGLDLNLAPTTTATAAVTAANVRCRFPDLSQFDCQCKVNAGPRAQQLLVTE